MRINYTVRISFQHLLRECWYHWRWSSWISCVDEGGGGGAGDGAGGGDSLSAPQDNSINDVMI